MARTYTKGGSAPLHPNVDWTKRQGVGRLAQVPVFCDICQVWRIRRGAPVACEIRGGIFTGNCKAHRALIGPRVGPYAPAVGVDYTAVKMLLGRGGRQRLAHVKTVCVKCGAERWRVPSLLQDQLRRGTFTGMCRFCSCKTTAEANSSGRHFNRDGYVIVTRRGLPDYLHATFDEIVSARKPTAKKIPYVHEHSVVMAHMLGRPLKSDETVHHKNGRRADNRPGNLRLYKRGDHHPGYGDFYQEWQEALAELARLRATHQSAVPS